MATDDAKVDEQQEIHFHYIKSTFFRVVHADGAFGGVTPRGNIQTNFYSERNAIPRKTVHPIKADGTLGDEIRSARVERDGPVREIEAGVVMDVNATKALIVWLQNKVDQIERRSDKG